MKCRDCKYCKSVSRTNGLYDGFGRSRKMYMCEHPDVNKVLDRGSPIYPFVGYGDFTQKSPLQLKTHKRWCPLQPKKR